MLQEEAEANFFATTVKWYKYQLTVSKNLTKIIKALTMVIVFEQKKIILPPKNQKIMCYRKN